MVGSNNAVARRPAPHDGFDPEAQPSSGCCTERK